MRTVRKGVEMDGVAITATFETKVLSAQEERRLLQALIKCKEQLSAAMAQTPGADMPADNAADLSDYIANQLAADGLAQAELGAVYQQYSEIRSKLALANMRLVAHVAKRFRDRGVTYSDLLQEGFCGLLEAIDRFDLNHGTKLATYATWWIRQAMQRTVAATAYPVRLSPRHLRQLARNQEELGRTNDAAKMQLKSVTDTDVEVDVDIDLAMEDAEPLPASTSEMIQRIHAATRPTVSLDATVDSESSFNLLQTMCNPESDRTREVDMDETVTRLMESLRPREQRVLSLRFGLGGSAKHSLSQVGKVLEVSKERVRQIQDRALEKLRQTAVENNLMDSMLPG